MSGTLDDLLFAEDDSDDVQRQGMIQRSTATAGDSVTGDALVPPPTLSTSAPMISTGLAIPMPVDHPLGSSSITTSLGPGTTTTNMTMMNAAIPPPASFQQLSQSITATSTGTPVTLAPASSTGSTTGTGTVIPQVPPSSSQSFSVSRMFQLLKQALPESKYVALKTQLQSMSKSPTKTDHQYILQIVKHHAGDDVFSTIMRQIQQEKSRRSTMMMMAPTALPLSQLPPSSSGASSAILSSPPDNHPITTATSSSSSGGGPLSSSSSTTSSSIGNIPLDTAKLYDTLLKHVVACTNVPCPHPKCDIAKNLIRHSQTCPNRHTCPSCAKLLNIIKLHVKLCPLKFSSTLCPIPYCDLFRKRERDMMILQQQQNHKSNGGGGANTTSIRSSSSPYAPPMHHSSTSSKSPSSSSKKAPSSKSKSQAEIYGEYMQIILHAQSCPVSSDCQIAVDSTKCMEVKSLLDLMNNAPNAPPKAKAFKQVIQHYQSCKQPTACPVCIRGNQPIIIRAGPSFLKRSHVGGSPTTTTTDGGGPYKKQKSSSPHHHNPHNSSSSSSSSLIGHSTSKQQSDLLPPERMVFVDNNHTAAAAAAAAVDTTNNNVQDNDGVTSSTTTAEIAKSLHRFHSMAELRKESDLLFHTSIDLQEEKALALEMQKPKRSVLSILPNQHHHQNTTELFQPLHLESRIKNVAARQGLCVTTGTTGNLDDDVVETLTRGLEEYLKRVLTELIGIGRRRQNLTLKTLMENNNKNNNAVDIRQDSKAFHAQEMLTKIYSQDFYQQMEFDQALRHQILQLAQSPPPLAVSEGLSSRSTTGEEHPALVDKSHGPNPSLTTTTTTSQVDPDIQHLLESLTNTHETTLVRDDDSPHQISRTSSSTLEELAIVQLRDQLLDRRTSSPKVVTRRVIIVHPPKSVASRDDARHSLQSSTQRLITKEDLVYWMREQPRVSGKILCQADLALMLARGH